mmetsp:Transcript_76344/g.220633  ORF Transcript_76344/g.220633 Transcript_76344/m.220633 type:complete len:267 (-) Transcript_76344:516-1316(-)
MGYPVAEVRRLVDATSIHPVHACKVDLHDLVAAELLVAPARGPGMPALEAVAAPRAPHREVQDEVELLAERPRRGLEEDRRELMVDPAIEHPTDAAVLPLDGIGVPLAHSGVRHVGAFSVQDVIVGAGVHRAIDPVGVATDGLHDVDLAARGPMPEGALGGQHPDRGPGATAAGQPGADVDLVAGPPLGQVQGRQLRGGEMLEGEPLALRCDSQDAAADMGVVLEVVLQLPVAKAAAAVDQIPLGLVHLVPIELVRPHQGQLRGDL